MYCKKLKLDFELDTSVLKNIQACYTKVDVPAIFKIKQTDIDPHLLNFLYQLDLTVFHAEAFYTVPKGKLFIHIDSDRLSDNCKLNWVYGGSGSTMEWWERNNPNEPLTHKLTDIGTKYIFFDRNKCTKVWEEEIGQPSLVNVGIPHSVNNPNDEGRWCLSFVIYDLEKKQVLQWADAVKKFSKWLT